jgi:hypothetical protein
LFARLKTDEVEKNSRRYQIIKKVMDEIKELLEKSENEK